MPLATRPPAHGHTTDPSAQGGDTALHLAAYCGSASCCEALLDAGADVDASNEVRPSTRHSARFYRRRVLACDHNA